MNPRVHLGKVRVRGVVRVLVKHKLEFSGLKLFLGWRLLTVHRMNPKVHLGNPNMKMGWRFWGWRWRSRWRFGVSGWTSTGNWGRWWFRGHWKVEKVGRKDKRLRVERWVLRERKRLERERNYINESYIGNSLIYPLRSSLDRGSLPPNGHAMSVHWLIPSG